MQKKVEQDFPSGLRGFAPLSSRRPHFLYVKNHKRKCICNFLNHPILLFLPCNYIYRTNLDSGEQQQVADAL